MMGDKTKFVSLKGKEGAYVTYGDKVNAKFLV